MAIVSVKCQNCGKDVKFDDTADKVFCTYCGEIVPESCYRTAVPVTVLTDTNETEVTIFYTKPFWGKGPYVVAIIDDKYELQLKNRVKVHIPLTLGEHTVSLRPLSIMSLKSEDAEVFKISITGEDVFETKYAGDSLVINKIQ